MTFTSLGFDAWLALPATDTDPPFDFHPRRASTIVMPLAGGRRDAMPMELVYGVPSTGDGTLLVVSSLEFEGTTTIGDGNGGTMPYATFGLIQHYTRPGELDAKPFAPVLGPPTDIRIGGVDAFAGASGVGVAPVFTWSPAVSFDASFASSIVYDLRIDPLVVNSNVDAGNGSPPVSTRFRTSETRIAVPPGIVELGQRYAVRLSASAVGGTSSLGIARDVVYVETAPFSP